MNAARSAAEAALKGVSSAAKTFDRQAYLKAATKLLTPGKPKAIFDYLSPVPSHQLNVSLAGHIPRKIHHPPEFRDLLAMPPVAGLKHPPRPPPHGVALPAGHHLVYFAPQIPPADLLPDGTDADHCPGAPFTRRMWAGGSVRFLRPGGAWGGEADQNLRLDGRRAVCVEEVGADPVIKGPDGDEKVFVDVVRRYGLLRPGSGETAAAQLARRRPEDTDIEETRTLVFLRERANAGAAAEREGRQGDGNGDRDVTRLKALKDRNMVPTLSFALVPDKRLLFHFSALTNNAHAIHLDRRYVQDVEGHRDLLVHGPLSLSLMLMALRAQADAQEEDTGLRVALTEVKYRNLAPLYVGEEMKVCVRSKQSGPWDVWVEGPDGRFAVKGTALFEAVPSGDESKTGARMSIGNGDL